MGGWVRELVWEDTLSLGEQQRLGMARLFFNKPRYGVLNECTSAVSVEVEERLHTAARELGITCITISQRLALTEFHTQELRLGEAMDAGWSLHDIPSEPVDLRDDDDDIASGVSFGGGCADDAAAKPADSSFFT